MKPRENGIRIVLCCALLSLLLGCESRRLSWQYVDKAPEQVAKARRVAFSHRISGGKGPAAEDMTSAITTELLSRNYRVATKETGADLVLEFSTRLTQETVTSTTSVPIPFVHKSSTKSEVKEELHQVSLNIISPADQAIVGTVTVEYPKATDKPCAAIKDAMLGLDMIRHGRAPATVKLKGKAGEAQ